MIPKPSYLWAHALTAISLALGAAAVFSGPSDDAIANGGYPKSLSQFGFFDRGDSQKPNDTLIPYTLNTPLFSDYAEKSRYIYIADGKIATAQGDGLINFPTGSAIIKNFGYMQDGKMQWIETRVLLRRDDEWLALPYVWNDAQDDAVLKLAGKRLEVGFADRAGFDRTIDYAVPNKNQCKECHGVDNEVMPIGPKIRNLSADSLERLRASQKLQIYGAGANPKWDIAGDEGQIGRDARAYLDINCAHCHNDQGSASNSGLFLNYDQINEVAYGLYKRPVAAGRGSGGFEFAINPGSADTSIIVHRMKSNDAGVAMPQIGRSIAHDEGIVLISEWINKMQADKKVQQ